MLAPSLTAMAEVKKSRGMRSLNAGHISFKENGAHGYGPRRCRMDEDHVPSAVELDEQRRAPVARSMLGWLADHEQAKA
jgi:hypothetical protein